jgi:hypothetical protein
MILSPPKGRFNLLEPAFNEMKQKYAFRITAEDKEDLGNTLNIR